jgi:hypothetical protein
VNPAPAQNHHNPEAHVNKPTLITSKSVFLPRGTATYTPKWSIVVLAVACLGVLKFNGLRAKTDRARPSTASFFPIIESKTVPNVPPVVGTASVDPGIGVDPGNEASNAFSSHSQASNHMDSAALVHLKNGR